MEDREVWSRANRVELLVQSVLGKLPTFASRPLALLAFALMPLAASAGDYEWLEYVQSTGTQYVDTGLRARNDVRMLMRASGIHNATGATYLGCAIEAYKYSWGTGSYALDFLIPGANMGNTVSLWLHALCHL